MANFRKFATSTGKQVLAGKSAENNEELVEQAGKEETVLHTKAPGSPFANIKLKENENTSKQDIKESAVFCARYSQDWRDNKKDVIVHYFKGKDIYKEKEMKLGTFGVKNTKEIKIKKEEIEKFLEEKR
jgi:predicted ribosome quality control (RQC) complex YloA/Tae2 family protein